MSSLNSPRSIRLFQWNALLEQPLGGYALAAGPHQPDPVQPSGAPPTLQ